MQFHNDGSFKLRVIKSIYRNKHHLGFAGVSKLKKKKEGGEGRNHLEWLKMQLKKSEAVHFVPFDP